ncbi:MAG: glycosyltransferase family 4 protein [Anaerolineales bacterium]|nr:glycosyltransferase family 4 protein [Anaerolineales bacterium]MDW8276566.1 glycosyltransferase family 4 protein [Anaerolineales bacterium]
MTPKIALVHDWFITYAGAERVVEQILHVFPEADLFALLDFMPAPERNILQGKRVTTSFLQTFPLLNRKNYRNFLPLMPLAIEQLDLSGYDIVLTNCHAVSKGVITSPEQLHISYVHTPMRYAWDMQNDYLAVSGMKNLKSALARLILHYMRLWDTAAASRPDVLYGNSAFICRRIEKIYRRKAQVLYPPVNTDYFSFHPQKEDFYLTASRLVPYKRIDLVVEAFAGLPDRQLVVIGDGPERRKLQSLNLPNVRWLGFQPNEVLRDYMQRARAFVFAAKEDFGIIPLEAQACGTPVIALGAGGARETVIGLAEEHPTGVFFAEQTIESLRAAILDFEQNQHRFDPAACRANAERFSNQRFRREIRQIIETRWEAFCSQKR